MVTAASLFFSYPDVIFKLLLFVDCPFLLTQVRTHIHRDRQTQSTLEPERQKKLDLERRWGS